MTHEFDFLKITRNLAVKLADSLSIEQLNTIPPSFSNNLIWNLGHMLVTQQLLIYSLSGLKPLVDNETISKYRSGTKPENLVNIEEFEMIKEKILETSEALKNDFQAGKFQNFKPYRLKTFGADLTNVEAAIVFNNIHEGLHLGYMMSIKNLV